MQLTNPAATIARMFSDTFTGIAPASVPMFIVFQILGAALGAGLAVLVHPDTPGRRRRRRRPRGAVRSASRNRPRDRPLRVRDPGPNSATLTIHRGATAPAPRPEPAMNFWDIILSIFWFMLLFAWIWLLISIFADIFRDHELSGWGKALWTLFIIVIPWLGALVYLIARGRSMNERTLAQAQRQDQAFRHYVQDAAGNQPSAADEIAKLATLRDQGAISEQEFAHAKAKLLGTPSSGAPLPPNQAASVR